jgi:hypothetical protein
MVNGSRRVGNLAEKVSDPAGQASIASHQMSPAPTNKNNPNPAMEV